MHLLCGIDTSDSAPAVAYAAARVAERMGAELTLAHVASTADRAVSAYELNALADDIAAVFGIRPDVCTEPADCPVMVVPPGAASPTGSGVAVAYDTLAASAGAVAVAAHLASALEERLTVIHVLPDPRSSSSLSRGAAGGACFGPWPARGCCAEQRVLSSSRGV